MRFFNRLSNESSGGGAGRCLCKNNEGVFIELRQLSWIVAGLITLAFLGFMAGYFLGQKKVLEQFSTKLEQDSLSDKISSSLCSIYDIKTEAEETDTAESEESVPDEPRVAQAEPQMIQNAATQVVQTPKPVADGKRYYAQLVGFGSSESAQAFANRLSKKNISVFVKKRQSTSGRGRIRSWYQVVTKPYETREALVAVVDKIKQAERLNDIRILSC